MTDTKATGKFSRLLRRPSPDIRRARRDLMLAELNFANKSALYSDYADMPMKRGLSRPEADRHRETVERLHGVRERAFVEMEAARARLERLEADATAST